MKNLDASLMAFALVVLLVLGGLVVQRLASPTLARRSAVALATIGLALGFGLAGHQNIASDALALDPLGWLGVDALSALLVPFVVLLGWTLLMAAPRVWARPAALGRLLSNVGLLVGALLTRDARVFVALWALTLAPTYFELRRTPGAASGARVFAVYAALSSVTLLVGLGCLGLPLAHPSDVWKVRSWFRGGRTALTIAGFACVVAAVFMRKAIMPFHSWLPTVFAAAPPGPVLLLVAPMLGPYALVRFAIPLSPEILGEHGLLLGPPALVTAAYAAGLAFVQTELRRAVAWLVISQSALVLVGLECPEGAGLTGSLVAWLSTGTAMMGIGLSAWMLEARFGPLHVDRHQGLYRRAPSLALVFLLCGLGLVAFPGTIGFASDDLLVRAILRAFPSTGLLLFFAIALNGFTLLRAYLKIFHGPPAAGPELRLLPREWIALLVPLGLVIWQGVYPAPLVTLGANASVELLGRLLPAAGP